jgi:hypothetical protein
MEVNATVSYGLSPLFDALTGGIRVSFSDLAVALRSFHRLKSLANGAAVLQAHLSVIEKQP